MKQKKIMALLLVGGSLYCAFLTLLPDMTAMIFSPPERIWTPIASFNYRYNDAYYQVPWVRKITTGDLLPSQPSNISAQGLGFEATRVVPFWLSSLPGLVFSDIRSIIFSGFALTAALIYSLSFAIAFVLTRNLSVAALAGIASYFFQAVWSSFPVEPWLIRQMLSSGQTWEWLRLPNLVDITDISMINDNLRYVSLAAANPILLAHYLLCLKCARQPSVLAAAGLGVTAIALAFSYPPHTIIGYSISGLYLAYSLIARQWRVAQNLVIAFAIAAIFLWAVDYPAIVRAGRESHPLYFELFRLGFSNFRDILDATPDAKTAAVLLLFNKYSLAFVPCALISSDRELRRDLFFLYLVSLMAVAFYLTDPAYLVLRALFTQRGVDILWAVLIPATLFGAAFRQFGRLSIVRLAAIAPAAAIVGVPVVAFADYAHRIATTPAIEAETIPLPQWLAYDFLARHADRSQETLATDWDDVLLLPAVAPVNLFFGNIELQGRTPRDMLVRFAAAQKFLGMEREKFRELIHNSFRYQYEVAFNATKRSSELRTPFLSRDRYQSAHFSFAILYWHYVTKFEGVPFLVGTTDINPAFENLVMDIYDGVDATRAICNSKIAAVILAREDTWAITQMKQMGHRVVFENSLRVVFDFDRPLACRP